MISPPQLFSLHKQNEPTLETVNRALSLIEHFEDTGPADADRGRLRDIVCHVFVNGILTREELAKHGIDNRAIESAYNTSRVTMSDESRGEFFDAIHKASTTLRKQLALTVS